MATLVITTRRALAWACLVAATTVSCGDDGPGPLGVEPSAPSYHVTLESFSGSLQAVCGSDANDVFAVGPSILHYDGSTWSAIELPERRASRILAAWGGSGDGPFLADSDGDIFRRKGDEWSWDAHLQGINDMWASGPSDVYVVGYDGGLHFDGDVWRELDLPTDQSLHAVTGTAANDVVAVGRRGVMLHFDGDDWTSVELDTLASYRAVARTASGKTYVADFGGIYEVVGSTPQRILQFELVGPALCADGDALYAAGQDPRNWDAFAVRRYADGVWTDVSSGAGRIADLWRAPDGELFAVGEPSLLWRGRQGGEVMTPYPRRPEIVDGWSVDGTAFLVGVGAYRVENGQWTDLNKEYVTMETAVSIHGRTRDDIYAVGRGMILHFDGERWTWVNGGFGAYLTGVWAGPDDNVVAVGFNLDTGEVLVVEYDGNEWKKAPAFVHDNYLRGVWGSGERVFAVGGHGLIAVRERGEWFTIPSPTTADLWDVWGLDDRHVYALSSNPGEICFFDGRTWEAMQIDDVYLYPMVSVWGSSPNDLFVADELGTIARFDGRGWSALPRILGEGARTICGVAGGDLLVAGYYGTAIYRRQ